MPTAYKGWRLNRMHLDGRCQGARLFLSPLSGFRLATADDWCVSCGIGKGAGSCRNYQALTIGEKNRQVRESLLEHLSIGWVATPIGSGGWFG